MKYLISCLLALFLLAASSFGQVRSGVGTLVSTEGGTGSGTACLKIGKKILCLEWSASRTKFTGFRRHWPDGTLATARKLNLDPWEEGAEWHITYSAKDMFLRSASFQRRVIRQ